MTEKQVTVSISRENITEKPMSVDKPSVEMTETPRL